MNITKLNFNRNQLILLLSGGIILALLLYALLRESSTIASLDEVTRIIASNQVEKAVVDGNYLYLSTSNEGVVKILSSQLPAELTSHLKIEVKSSNGWLWFLLLFALIGTVVFWVARNRKAEISSIHEETPLKSAENESINVQSPVAVKSNVRFSDIGGIGDVKEELEEIIDFLRNPKRYYNFGARMPRGVLLVGPPGVGKTMIAKALVSCREHWGQCWHGDSDAVC